MTATHLAACGLGNGFAAIALDGQGMKLWQRILSYRAHDVLADPARQICAVIGRKPGPLVSICDLATGNVLRELAPLPNCHFDGHGVFAADGSLLYTTQSEGRAQRGMIGVYDTATGMLLRHFSSHGIEPHELLWSADGQTLVIGNGGVVNRNATDPIDSSLARVNATSGALLGKTVLDEDFETLSLRHIARLADGRIVCGAQDQDPATDLRPLVFVMSETGDVEAFSLPRDIHRRLAGYIGSVAVDARGEIICATSPRGHLAVFWTGQGHYIGHADLADTCGVSATLEAGQFMLTSGHGMRLRLSVSAASGVQITEGALPADPWRWDNHLHAVTGA